MKKFFIFFTIVLLYQSVGGQILLSSYDLDIKKRNTKNEVYSVVDADWNETYLIHREKSSLKGYHFSLAFLLKDSIQIDIPDNMNLQYMVGSRIDSIGKIWLFWTDQEFRGIKSTLVDFNTNSIEEGPFIETFEDENVVQLFSVKNTFYLLTLPTKKNLLRLYSFGKGGAFTPHTFRLDDYSFTNEKDKTASIRELFEKTFPDEPPYSLELISDQFPANIHNSFKKRKLYLQDNQLLLSFDLNPKQSEWLIIDLELFSFKRQNIPYVDLQTSDSKKEKYTSFLWEDFVFHLKANEDSFLLGVSDLKTGRMIKKFDVANTTLIPFKNSPLFYDPGRGTIINEMRKDKHFFKHNKKADWGISVYDTGENLLLTIGGMRERTPAMTLAGDIMLAGIGGYDPIIRTVLSSAYFDCLLDYNLAHRAGEASPTALAKINAHLAEIPYPDLITVFKRGSYYIAGYYVPGEKKYYLRQFMD